MNCFPPISLTPQQQLACNSLKWKGLDQNQQMGVLITIFAQLAGMQITCQSLQTYAAQYSCLPRNLQLPALIYLASQILANAPGDQVFLFTSGGLGTPPPFTPVLISTSFSGVSTGAIATDNSTGQQWVFWNGQWN